MASLPSPDDVAIALRPALAQQLGWTPAQSLFITDSAELYGTPQTVLPPATLPIKLALQQGQVNTALDWVGASLLHKMFTNFVVQLNPFGPNVLAGPTFRHCYFNAALALDQMAADVVASVVLTTLGTMPGTNHPLPQQPLLPGAGLATVHLFRNRLRAQLRSQVVRGPVASLDLDNTILPNQGQPIAAFCGSLLKFVVLPAL